MAWGIGDIWRVWMISNWSLMIMGVTDAHLEPIWYYSEPSDAPYSPNQFLGGDFFSSKSALNLMIIKHQVPVVQSWVIDELIIILSKCFVGLIALKLSNNNFGIEYTFIKSSITFLDRNKHPPKLGKQKYCTHSNITHVFLFL